VVDNVQLNAGTGGALIHTDDLGGSPAVHVQRMKVGHGVDGSYSDASATAPLPVKLYDLIKKAWRCGFDRVYAADGVDPLFLAIVGTKGSGMAYSQSGGSLVVTTGTTANSETILRSVESFSGSMRLRYSMLLSQRIANQNFYVELVDVIGDACAVTVNSATSITVTFPSGHGFTSANVGQSMMLGAFSGISGAIGGRYAIASITGDAVTFTVAGFPGSGSGTCSAFGWNYMQVTYSGTTATAADWDCQRKGWASGATTMTINTSASTHVGTMKISDSEASYQDQTGASATGLELTRRASRVRNVPETSVVYRLQIRIKNGTSSPASTTTMTVGVADINANDPLSMSISEVEPMSANSALPVEVANPTTTVTANQGTNAALVAGTAAIGDIGVQYRANATGAASRTHIVSAASTNAANAKASAGRVLGWSFTNTNAAYRYVKLHNTAGTPTAGASVFMTIAIPPNGVADFSLDGGIGFSTGIGYSIVTGSADADATAVGAGDVVGDLFWA
jgi:hypothetical protein